MITMPRSELISTIEFHQDRIEMVLEHYLALGSSMPPQLIEAMRYATLGGGKRLRPLLVYASGEAVGARKEVLDPIAAAIELVHVYSLIHDDLPAMDDDDLRRGKPSCHRQFNEATAILAGDALQALAFEVLLDTAEFLPKQSVVALLRGLTYAAGLKGMAGGQALDLESEGKQIDLATLEQLHRMKTGALITTSVLLPALAVNLPSSKLQQLEKFSTAMGLAFQIRDDLLDIEGDPETLGKACGADILLDKATFPALIGIEASRRRTRELLREALEALEIFHDEANLLRQLARFMVDRNQ